VWEFTYNNLSISSRNEPYGVYVNKNFGLTDTIATVYLAFVSCSVAAGEAGRTGWLLQREGDAPRWYVDLKCMGCGSRGVLGDVSGYP
jgi:hypothetical protein